jgi:hypothetical protein
METKEHPIYKGYKIDIEGNIYGKTGVLLKGFDKEGYIQHTINGEEYPVHKKGMAHRMVAETFIPNPNGYECINHKNGIRHDNRVENLEWCSRYMNHRHAVDVLGTVESKKVRVIKTGVVYNSIKEAARLEKFSVTTITKDCYNRHALSIIKRYEFV